MNEKYKSRKTNVLAKGKKESYFPLPIKLLQYRQVMLSLKLN